MVYFSAQRYYKLQKPQFAFLYIYRMILVTGATGLVGAHLVAKLLHTEQRIKALFRSEDSKAITKKILSYYWPDNTDAYFSKIIWFQADLADIPALTDSFHGVSHVYHCAGLISYDPKDYQLLQKVNSEGTATIVNLCLSFEVEKLCHVSSIAALGKEPNGQPITEKPDFEHDGKQSSYALTKYGGEMEVWRGSQEGLDVVIVNPGIIIGAGSWDSGSGLLFKKIADGLQYSFPKVTGFVGVEDVVEIMISLMQKPVKNERYVLVAENLSFKQVLFEIAENLHHPPPKKELKPWMVFLGWLFQWTGSKLFGTKRQITKQSIKGLFDTSSVYDSTKIKEELDFQFRDIKRVIHKTSLQFLQEKETS